MAPNHKLTSVIKGRKVVGTSNEDGKSIVTFDDGSTLRIKTGASSTGSSQTETAVSTSGNAVASDVVANQNQQNLTPPQTQRNDVFRNLKWNETAFNDDVSRQITADNTPHSEVQAAATTKTSATTEAGALKVSINQAATSQAATGGTVKSVLQGDTAITLQFEDGGKMDFPLAEASSSVMLRGKDNTMEYAD
jgi:hypothetical protein